MTYFHVFIISYVSPEKSGKLFFYVLDRRIYRRLDISRTNLSKGAVPGFKERLALSGSEIIMILYNKNGKTQRQGEFF